MDGSVFAGRLLEKEKLVWTGRPRQGFMLTPRDWFLIPFSLLWCGFVVFWESEVLRTKAPVVMIVFGACFLGIGLFFFVGRFFVDAWLRGRTFYALSDSRILILRTSPRGAFQAVRLDRVPESSLIEEAHGRGTIRFGPPAPALTSRSSWSFWVPSLDPTPQFLGVADARRVFALIQERARPET